MEIISYAAVRHVLGWPRNVPPLCWFGDALRDAAYGNRRKSQDPITD